MLNIIITYDEADELLGEYFDNCFVDLEDYLKKKNCDWKITVLNSSNSTNENLYKIISNSKMINILIAFCHGSDESLYFSNKNVLSVDDDLSIYNNTFLYTNSCSTGKKLGPKLIQEGMIAFWGYKNDTWAYNFYETFVKCDNYGLKKLLEGQSFQKAFDEALDNYTDAFLEMLESDDMDATIAAVMLQENRDCMVKYGNLNFSVKDI